MSWCGRYEGGWGGPCKLDVVVAILLFLVAASVGAFQTRKLRLVGYRRLHGRASQFSWQNAALIALYGTNAAVHAGWLVASATLSVAAGFQIFTEAVLLVSWASAVALCILERRRGVTISLRLLAWPATLGYGIRVYVGAHVLVAHSASAALGLALVVTACIQTVLFLCASIVELLKRPDKEEEDALKEALLEQEGEPQRRKGSRSWLSLLATAVIYVWPDAIPMQLRVAGCVLIVAFVRALNLAVPVLYRNAINKLAEVTNLVHPRGAEKPEHFTFMEQKHQSAEDLKNKAVAFLIKVFYPVVLLYMVAAFLQGGPASSMGLLNNIRSFLFIRVSQDAYRRISVELFSHTLNLDLKFHLMRKTGEVTRQLDRGTAAIQNVLSTVVFNIGPSLFDIAAASVYVAASLNVWVAVIVFTTMASYIPVTIWLTEWRGGLRRDLNRTDNVKSARCTDALLNYETVLYFSNQDLEVKRYGDAVGDYQAVEWRLLASLSFLNILQTVIVWIGVSCGLIVCVKGTANGSLTVGDTILFMTIMQQLYGLFTPYTLPCRPLNYFGTYYRQIQQYMIDMENMFDLFAKKPSIQDAPDARALEVEGAPSVTFEDVSFHFVPGSPVLENVSFTAGSGETLALVGATGSGKSTVVRLVYRLYDPISGRICLDGQDLRGLQQKSLRAVMGMVPQDVVLFNDTIEFNIRRKVVGGTMRDAPSDQNGSKSIRGNPEGKKRYGRPDASKEEIEAAAQAACIHDAITDRFPYGYQTIVGERGLRLSGGEKQRVGVARAILKSPGLLLMDEATSALDSITEQRIQEALSHVRSTRIIVAHRLSTIMDATKVIVMKEGCVEEVGSHPELMQQQGLYAEMWMRQAESSRLGASQNPSSLSLASQQQSDSKERS